MTAILMRLLAKVLKLKIANEYAWYKKRLIVIKKVFFKLIGFLIEKI